MDVCCVYLQREEHTGSIVSSYGIETTLESNEGAQASGGTEVGHDCPRVAVRIVALYCVQKTFTVMTPCWRQQPWSQTCQKKKTQTMCTCWCTQLFRDWANQQLYAPQTHTYYFFPSDLFHPPTWTKFSTSTAHAHIGLDENIESANLYCKKWELALLIKLMYNATTGKGFPRHNIFHKLIPNLIG